MKRLLTSIIVAALALALAACAAGMATYLVPEWATPTPEVVERCAAVLGSLRELPAAVLGRDAR